MSVSNVHAELVVDSRCELGEGPTWDAARQRLLWLDINVRHLHELDAAGRHSVSELAGVVTAIALTPDGGMIGAVDCSVARLHPNGEVGDVIARLPSDGVERTNDGKCDRQGRFWVGTVDRSGANRAELFRVDVDGSVDVALAGVGLSNGLDWSPDGAVCHYVDSLAANVRNLHLGPDGLPVQVTTLVDVDGVPDGLTVDADGGVWVALWERAAVHRYTPDGRLDVVVEVPGAGHVSSCAFGGADLSTLYITTAWETMSPEQRREVPHAGGLFVADVGRVGRPPTLFG